MAKKDKAKKKSFFKTITEQKEKKTKAELKEKVPELKEIKPINIVNVVKQGMVQIKYEEIGSWLVMHKTPLFYAHKDGFSVVDQKFIERHPKLKAELDKMVKEITKKKPAKIFKQKKEDVGYIG